MKVHLPEGAKRRPRATPHARRGTLLCPRCGSHRIAADLGFIDGARYLCRDCGFRGPLVVTGIRPEPAAPKGEGDP